MSNPSARVSMSTKSDSTVRLHLYNYGEDERVINQGDLLIVSETLTHENGVVNAIEFELTIKGKDLSSLAAYVTRAQQLWDENSEYLSRPVTTIAPDRASENLAAVEKYYRPRKRA